MACAELLERPTEVAQPQHGPNDFQLDETTAGLVQWVEVNGGYMHPALRVVKRAPQSACRCEWPGATLTQCANVPRTLLFYACHSCLHFMWTEA
jgi:hypothetical protein